MENSAEMSQIEELLKQVAWFLVTLNGVGYNCLISIEWSRNYVVENIKFVCQYLVFAGANFLRTF